MSIEKGQSSPSVTIEYATLTQQTNDTSKSSSVLPLDSELIDQYASSNESTLAQENESRLPYTTKAINRLQSKQLNEESTTIVDKLSGNITADSSSICWKVVVGIV
ncbi:unnamed protein product, partial [Rotaria sp. Silwood1]